MECWHMSGAGNDFMVVDARGRQMDFSQMAKELCARSGADGFMAVDEAQGADFRLHFYNSDGSRGEMCGNGARCVCRFAYEHGIVGPQMTVLTDAGLVPGLRLNETQYQVLLNLPTVMECNRKPGVAYVELGNPGLPHAVLERPGLNWKERDALRQQARALRFDPAFPKGANVNFYTWLAPGHIRILTFERGVEDFTLACGTGTGATAVVLYIQGELPDGVLVAENPGGTLRVRISGAPSALEAVQLEGPTQIIQKYEL